MQSSVMQRTRHEREDDRGKTYILVVIPGQGTQFGGKTLNHQWLISKGRFMLLKVACQRVQPNLHEKVKQ